MSRKEFQHETRYICICSRFYKYGRILSKFGMQVSIDERMAGKEFKMATRGSFSMKK
jgi:hypothetical protein